MRWKRVLYSFFAVTILTLGLAGIRSATAQDAVNPDCDPASYAWGPAGPAPCTTDLAAKALGAEVAAPAGTAELVLTVLYGTPGNATPIGWVLGTSGTSDAGVQVVARTVPSGTCVDFDPGASALYGTYQYVDFTPKWRRALLSTDGAFAGLKASVYWTPCDMKGMTAQAQPSGMEVIPTNLMPAGSTGGASATPDAGNGSGGGTTTTASATAAAALFDMAPLNVAANWELAPMSTTQVVFTSPGGLGLSIAVTVPDGGYTIDYDKALGGDGNAASGEQVPVGATVFTLNWPSS